MKKIIFMALLFMGAVGALSAQKVITGKVVDKSGNVITGAKVGVSKSDDFVLTDFDGVFRYETDKTPKKLVVDYVGMRRKRVAVSSNDLMVEMARDKQSYVSVRTSFRWAVARFKKYDECVLFSGPAITAELVYGFRLSETKPVFAEVGLGYSGAYGHNWGWGTEDNSDSEVNLADMTDVNFNSIELSAVVGYKKNLGQKSSVFPYLGFSIRRSTDNGSILDTRQFLWGTRLGVNFNIRKFLAGIGYDLDLSSSAYDVGVMYSRTPTLKIGLTF